MDFSSNREHEWLAGNRGAEAELKKAEVELKTS
jgi:hypothetical protein